MRIKLEIRKSVRHDSKNHDELSLADHIRRAAEESGLSVNRLATIARVDQSTLNKFLTGSRPNLRLDIAERLFQVLGLKVVRDRRHRSPREYNVIKDKLTE